MNILTGLIERAIKSYLTEEKLAKVVYSYLDNLEESQRIKTIAKIMGAQGLTNKAIKEMLDSIKGERVIEIHFGNGDMAIISNRQPDIKVGPGW